MSNKLSHGSLAPGNDDGIWYCTLHRIVGISSRKPCVHCEEKALDNGDNMFVLVGGFHYCKPCGTLIKCARKDKETEHDDCAFLNIHKNRPIHIGRSKTWRK